MEASRFVVVELGEDNTPRRVYNAAQGMDWADAIRLRDEKARRYPRQAERFVVKAVAL